MWNNDKRTSRPDRLWDYVPNRLFHDLGVYKMTPITKARIPLRDKPEEIWDVVDVLPGGQVNLTRVPHPLEKMWGGYMDPYQTANRAGITRVFCQVNSVKDLEVVK